MSLDRVFVALCLLILVMRMIQLANMITQRRSVSVQVSAGNRAGVRSVEPPHIIAAHQYARHVRTIERIEVDAERVSEAQLNKIYATNGPPQAVIIVCSGKRTAPGVWTHRTIWFARPAVNMSAA